jgi:hypothetical protein|tara:strand:+ start:2641 stop:9747 length:7107 start_codon:yes stop_codon:yes gene_type:complete
MSQKTNLNTSPYYDDFDPGKNFHRVLFKPGYPVQSRELSNLQSILQDQVEKFGSHFFKEGSSVNRGQTWYDSQYYAVKIKSSISGVDVSLYLNELVGKTIKGQDTQVKGVVRKVLTTLESDDNVNTIYVKYNQGDTGFEFKPFSDGESLITDDSVTYGNTTIASGDIVAECIDFNATSIGSAYSIGESIYFIRGHFINVSAQEIILDQYTNSPTYRIGLEISEELINAKQDNSLFDNAKGFSNFAAPGADRLKISTKLVKKRIDDFDDRNFVELERILNGVIVERKDPRSEYNLLEDYFAQRTFEESGNYSLQDYKVEVQNSLNDRINSNGIFLSNERTQDNNIPSEDLLTLKVSPGTSYVEGYKIDTRTAFIDLKKPRETTKLTETLIPFEMGNLIRVNNVSGTPLVGIDNSSYLNLQNQRKGGTTSATGTTIGQARVYSFASNETYENNSSSWDLYLFDVQTYTQLTLNTSASISESTYIKGRSSGASGYAVATTSGVEVNLRQTSGSFIAGEQLIINGVTETNRSIKSIRVYTTEDIKSVYQDTSAVSGFSTDFVADSVLSNKKVSQFSIVDTLDINGGIATCAGKNFVGIKSDSIIRYQRAGFSTPTFNRVESVSTDGLTLNLVGVATVANVCDGAVDTDEEVTFSVISPTLIDEEKAFLYAELPAKNVSEVSFLNSNINVNAQATGKSTSSTGELTVTLTDVGITSAFFDGFDTDKYSVMYEDGTIESLTQDQFSVTNNIVTIKGLKQSESNVVVNTSLKKSSVANKVKQLSRSQKTLVTRTRSGISTSYGLTSSSYHGLRVEDDQISLNTADATNLIAVYESLDGNSPSLDSLTFNASLQLNTNAILGEKIVGATSGAIAQIVTLVSAQEIEFVYLNDKKFSTGEVINFQESLIESSLVSISVGNYINRTGDYRLDNGQREQLYDYSRIVKSNNVVSPSRRLLIIFDKYVDSNSTGDLFTVNSYNTDISDIPLLSSGIRNSDILDFRPKVSDFNPDTATKSPFDFEARDFSSTTFNVISPNESSTLRYSNYLPRTDRLILGKDGIFKLITGKSAINAPEPNDRFEGMEIATISLPAYLFDVRDVSINLRDNRRFTMRDIRRIEDRVETLEKVTSLSLLELDTKSIEIQDNDGFNRFKSGFVVDDFKDFNVIDINNPDVNANLDVEHSVLTSDRDEFSLKTILAPASSINLNTLDYSTDYELLDSNLQKTGDLVTLKYEEVEWGILTQPLATRVSNVNPFNVVSTTGSIALNPQNDTWTRTVVIQGQARTRWLAWWDFANETFNDRLTQELFSSTADPFMRSRNVSFHASAINPYTRFYPSLDSNRQIDIIPKLLEINMVSGVFQVGETVEGFVGDERVISFRVASQDHKSGPYDAISTTPNSRFYPSNPYDNPIVVPLSGYNASSSVLNVDLDSLCQEAIGEFSGRVEVGMTLLGTTSGAEATLARNRLITDSQGQVLGSFFIRDPNATPQPSVKISTGSKVFKLSSSITDESLLPEGYVISNAEGEYTAEGTLETMEEFLLTVRRRNPPPPPPPPPAPRANRGDPLAQSFAVTDESGFISSVDLWFQQKDEFQPITVEIRPMELGLPTDRLLGSNATVDVFPDSINVSADANDSAYTRVTFPSPVFVERGREYAIVILSPFTNNYYAWLARMGEQTIETKNLPDSESVVYSRQYVGGSLFKSQNGTTWTADQLDDLKFRVNKCSFTSTEGTAYFYNPSLQRTKNTRDFNSPSTYSTVNNPITVYPRKLTVGLQTTTDSGSILTIGRKVGVADTTTGIIEQVGGNINGNPSITNVGTGYSTGTFYNVSLYNITGSGIGATATVVADSDGEISSVTIGSTGLGYVQGDVLGITTSDVIKGDGARLTVSSTHGINRLYLTDVVGETFYPNATTPLVYYVGNTSVSLGSTYTTSSSVTEDKYSGNVFEVIDHSHGMHASNNVVRISGVLPTSSAVKTTEEITTESTTITLENVGIFTSFEGQTVGAGAGQTTGYLLVGNEIISYNTAPNTTTNTITIGTREIDGSKSRTHASGSLVYKYELNGVSLTRINKDHNMSSNSASINSNKTIDTYQIEFDRSGRGSGIDLLSFTDERRVGGNNCILSQNVQYDSILPFYSVFAPGNTSSSASLRSVSATSSAGSEISFQDEGYEPIQLNKVNYLDSTRMVASHVNESERLSALPSNKSMTLAINLKGTQNLSPTIYIGGPANVNLFRNRINKPVTDYASDSRVNELTGDPHSSVYITKKISLSNPATSLKVILSAYRHFSADFRVLYQLYKSDSSEVEQSFELFPGYDNLNGQTVINPSRNNGRPDTFVRSSKENEFLDYEFTADDLGEFSAFKIKIEMSGTNESEVVQIRDFRAIALL